MRKNLKLLLCTLLLIIISGCALLAKQKGSSSPKELRAGRDVKSVSLSIGEGVSIDDSGSFSMVLGALLALGLLWLQELRVGKRDKLVKTLIEGVEHADDSRVKRDIKLLSIADENEEYLAKRVQKLTKKRASKCGKN